jgi:hypothetical protein
MRPTSLLDPEYVDQASGHLDAAGATHFEKGEGPTASEGASRKSLLKFFAQARARDFH